MADYDDSEEGKEAKAEELIENDEVSAEEEGFLKGYEEDEPEEDTSDSEEEKDKKEEEPEEEF